MKTKTMDLKLTADPLHITLAERKNFKITIFATNKGDEVIDPKLHQAKLFINNQESIPWTLAISNGARETKWFSLPPGETVSMSWSSLGKSLFSSTGEFTLVLHYFDKKLAPIHVEVRSSIRK